MSSDALDITAEEFAGVATPSYDEGEFFKSEIGGLPSSAIQSLTGTSDSGPGQDAEIEIRQIFEAEISART